MRVRSSSVVLLAVVSIAGPTGVAMAEVGEAVAVIQQAVARGTSGARMLTVGAPVFMGDLLRMGPVGETQLIFLDETRLVVGPNSSLTIDDYIVRDNRTVSKLTVNALVGSFRFITGLSPHQAYSIKTPSATIGVRGTSIDVSINRESTGVIVYSGEADVCDINGRNCVTTRAGCGAVVADPNSVMPVNEAEKAAFIEETFVYAVNQDMLRSDFQVDTGSCDLAVQTLLKIDPIEPSAIAPTAVSPN